MGKPKDDETARTILARIFAVNRVTYIAIALVWIAALSILAIPAGDRTLSEQFTVTIHDELREPVVDAQVRVIGSNVQVVSLERGIATIKYYPSLSSRVIRIDVARGNVRTSTRHQADPQGRFRDLTIALWSGEQPLRAGYFSVQGLAIPSVLEGRLPEDLRRRYPDLVGVVPNDVYRSARRIVGVYEPFDAEGIRYTRGEPGRGRRSIRATAFAERRSGEAWLQRFQLEARRMPFVRQVVATAEMDLSRGILGAPADQPLPPGFVARIHQGETWFRGTTVQPSDATRGMIAARFGATATGENGALSIQLDRPLTGADIDHIVRHATWHDDGSQSRAEIRRYLRLLIAEGMPLGLVRAIFLLDYDECEAQNVHVELQLPEPKLRFTILENAGTRPVQLDRLVMTQAVRRGFRRADAAVASTEVSVEQDVLAPGEAIIVPTELSIDADYSDEELRHATRRNSSPGRVAEFLLSPAPADEEVAAPEESAPSIDRMRPQRILLPLSRVAIRQPASIDAIAEEGREFSGTDVFEQRGPTYVLGPSVREIDYVVNGVRIRARSDTRSEIAMIGVWGSGSCPFVFVTYPGSESPVNQGQVITNHRGRARQGTDTMSIGPAFEHLEIRELEDEISYIDQARLVVRGAGGTRYYHPANRSLARRDGRYVILRKGERAPLEFRYERAPGDRSLGLEVNGYFDPL